MEDSNNKIIIISDLLKARAQREEELAFYTYQLEILQSKLNSIRHEINLTNVIIKMIKEENVKDVSSLMNKKD